MLKDIYRYGEEVNSHDLVKISAITTMVIDHAGRYLLGNLIWLRIIGRLAAPQFFFMVGYSGSYRFKREILIYGLALAVVDYFADTSVPVAEKLLPINILIAFVLIKAFMDRFDMARLPSVALLGVFAALMVMSLPTYVAIEYGTLGLSYAIGARLQSKGHGLALFWLFATVAVHYVFAMFNLPLLEGVFPDETVVLGLAAMAVVFVANLVLFTNYRFRKFNVRPGWLRTLAIYASRYSLEIYFFHLSAFMIVHKLLIA